MSPPRIKSSSSPRKALSVETGNVIALGERLVEDLGGRQEATTLTRWMAHYIAEQITIAQHASGAKRRAAGERCAKAILELWSHRYRLPDGTLPLAEFSRILETVRRIDPDNPEDYYPALRRVRAVPHKEPEDGSHMLKFAEVVDRAARTLIDLALRGAASKAESPETRALIKAALAAGKSPEFEAFDRLLAETDEADPDATSAAIKGVERRLATLDQFAEFCRIVRPGLESDLQQLRATKSKHVKATADSARG